MLYIIQIDIYIYIYMLYLYMLLCYICSGLVITLFVSIKESTVKYMLPSVYIKSFLGKPNTFAIFSNYFQ